MQDLMRIVFLCALVPAFFPTAAAQAQAAPESPRYNSVDLQAEAQREVANDTLNATLFVELNDTDPARLASALNKTANEALRIAGEYKAVRVRSGNNQTYPVYDRSQRQTGWRGRAEVRLESRDFPATAALIGKLQASLQLGSLGFSVSPEVRKQAENEIIAEAITAFRARAEIVRQALGGKGYRIRRLAVNTSGSPPPRPLMARAMAGTAQEVAPPQFEGGVSQVSVNVNGTIELE